MSKDKLNMDAVGETVTLIALGNTLLAPLYWVDAKLGISAALIATAAFLYSAHEIGKKRRPLENRLNNMNTFFGDTTGDKSTEMQNAAANIVAGGDVLFKEVFPQKNINRR